jgi:uncharacterized protein YheU (UPF0270 family)
MLVKMSLRWFLVSIFWVLLSLTSLTLVSCGGGGGGGDSEDSKQWTYPSDLSDYISFDGWSAILPRVAMGNNGDAIIVWQQGGGNYHETFKSEYRSGGWVHPASFNDSINPAGDSTYLSRVAMDDNGDAVITWYQSDGANLQIFKSEYRFNTWDYPLGLSDNISPDGMPTYYPHVAMDVNGDTIIVWYQSDGVFGFQIYKSEYRAGNWTNPVNLNDHINPLYGAINPLVAMDDNGDAVIVWTQLDESYNAQVFKSEYRNGSWTHPSGLSDNISPDGQDVIAAHVAMSNNGDAVIVWLQSDGTNNQIFKSEYRNGSWTHPADLGDNVSPDGQDANDPYVAMNANGNAVIVWRQSDGTYSQIYKSDYRAGTWKNPLDLNDNISPDGEPLNSNAIFTQAAMDDNGDAVIVWTQLDESYNAQVFKSEYRNGSWTHPSGLSDNISPDGPFADLPQVAMDKNGNAIIVWYQKAGSYFHIFKSEYR